MKMIHGFHLNLLIKMKLIRIKLLSDFRSLKKGFEMKFPDKTVQEQLISPICVVGKNGTGKSNWMELLCEIFYYLDSLLLEYPAENLLAKKKFGFEIEYKFNLTWNDAFEKWNDANFAWDESVRHVKIIKKADEDGSEPDYFLIDKNNNQTKLQRTGDTKRELKKKQKLVLPNKIIGYSSGMNELISSPFLKMQFHYFHEYQSRLQDDVLDNFEDGKLFYMNYESNAAIVVANYLLQHPDKLSVLEETVEIKELDSFRIVIEYGNSVDINPDAQSNNEKADITDFFKDKLKFLRQISTTQKQETIKDIATGSDKQIVTLDFKVTPSMKNAFRHFWGDTYNLYSFFHQLNLLNIYKIPTDKKDTVRNTGRGLNISNFLPKLASDQLLFRIEQVQVKKTKSNTAINYHNLSDGEHQFTHIIGTFMIMNQHKTFFILDEPETHFNPKWRSKLISTLNKVEKVEHEIAKENNSVREEKAIEMVLSTHSPFILSDSHDSKVWKFTKIEETPQADLIGVKTYGTSFSVLLDEAFDKSETISEMSSDYIEGLRTQIEGIELVSQTAKKTIEEFKSKVLLLGESVEKFELYSYLNSLTKDIKNKK